MNKTISIIYFDTEVNLLMLFSWRSLPAWFSAVTTMQNCIVGVAMGKLKSLAIG